MATSTQLAQALALKKQNPNLSTRDAVLQTKQATTPITPTVAPPLPTAPIQAPTQQPIAKAGDAVIGVNGERFVQANNYDGSTNVTGAPSVVNQSGGAVSQMQEIQALSTAKRYANDQANPPTSTPTTTPTPTTPAIDQAQIERDKITAQNKATLEQNKQQADLRQAERDKVTSDANNALASSESAILNTLRSGGIIPETVKTSPYYKSAQQTYNKLQQFSTYSTADLTTALNTGALLPGTSVYNEMMKDPAMKQKLQQAQMYTVGQPVNTNQVFTQVSNEILSNNPQTASYLDDGIITQDEYNQATNNAEVVAKAKDVESKTNEYNRLKAEYDAIEDEVKAQFPGSPFADSIIADRQKAKYKNLVLAKGEVDSAIGTLTEIKSQAANLFETNLKLYESRRAEQVARDNEVFKANLGLKMNQAEFDQKIAQQAQAMNDPVQAISTMVDEYKKLGIPFTRSTQQIIQDFKTSGQDLATYLSTLQGQIQSKPEYQAYKDKQSGTEWQSTNITRYNPLTGANESTPIFYRKKTSGGFEAVDLSGNPIDVSSITGGGVTGGGTPTGGYATTTTEMRTDRNMNPTAMTTDVARSMGLKEGVDYVQGDSFKSGNGVLYTAKLLGDPIETTIRAIDKGGFTTKSGQNRWTYTASMGLTNDNWKNMTYDQKVETVKQMYRHEGGNGKAIGETKQTAPVEVSASDLKAFESYDGKSIPEQYKTPAEKKAFVDNYNKWRDSRPGLKIEKGTDITNIKLAKPDQGALSVQTYTSRMLDAVNNLLPLEKNYANLSLAEQLKQQYLPGPLKSEQQKLIDLNKKNFITAVLRKQSGASIAPSEFTGEEIKYFPQPGDSQSVIIAKQNARNAEIKAMLTEAGYDSEGNSLSKYYNPPIIEAPTNGGESITDRLARLRKK